MIIDLKNGVYRIGYGKTNWTKIHLTFVIYNKYNLIKIK